MQCCLVFTIKLVACLLSVKFQTSYINLNLGKFLEHKTLVLVPNIVSLLTQKEHTYVLDNDTLILIRYTNQRT